MLTQIKNHTRKIQIAIWLTVVVLIVGAFFACSRSDQRSSVPPEKITLAYSTPPYTVLIDIAQKRGYFLQEGLDVTPRVYAYGKLAFEALLEGKADIATVGETPFMFAIMKGEKLSIIATIQTSNKNNAIVARKDRGISAPADLKDKKIGATLGTIGEFFMDAFLVSHGISRKQVKVVNLRPDEMHGALENGTVDAVSTWSPVPGELQNHMGEKGAFFYDADIYTQTFNIAASQEYIHGHAGIIRKLLRALVRAEEFADENPSDAREIIAERSGLDRASVNAMWNDNAFSIALDQSLVLALEDESQWAINSKLVTATKIPNYLGYVYLDGLVSVKPRSVGILK